MAVTVTDKRGKKQPAKPKVQEVQPTEQYRVVGLCFGTREKSASGIVYDAVQAITKHAEYCTKYTALRQPSQVLLQYQMTNDANPRWRTLLRTSVYTDIAEFTLDE